MSKNNISHYVITFLCCAGLGMVMAQPFANTAAAGSPQDLVNDAFDRKQIFLGHEPFVLVLPGCP